MIVVGVGVVMLCVWCVCVCGGVNRQVLRVRVWLRKRVGEQAQVQRSERDFCVCETTCACIIPSVSHTIFNRRRLKLVGGTRKALPPFPLRFENFCPFYKNVFEIFGCGIYFHGQCVRDSSSVSLHPRFAPAPMQHA